MPTDTGTEVNGCSGVTTVVHWCSWSVGPLSSRYACRRVSPSSYSHGPLCSTCQTSAYGSDTASSPRSTPIGSASPVDHEPRFCTTARLRGGWCWASRSIAASPMSRSGSVRQRLSAAQSLSACTRASSSTVAPESARNAPVANDETKSTTCSPCSADTSVHVWNTGTPSRARNTDSAWRPVAASACTIRNHRSVPSSCTWCDTGRSRAPIVESTCRNPPGNRPCPIVVSSTSGCGSSGPSASALPPVTNDTRATG